MVLFIFCPAILTKKMCSTWITRGHRQKFNLKTHPNSLLFICSFDSFSFFTVRHNLGELFSEIRSYQMIMRIEFCTLFLSASKRMKYAHLFYSDFLPFVLEHACRMIVFINPLSLVALDGCCYIARTSQKYHKQLDDFGLDFGRIRRTLFSLFFRLFHFICTRMLRIFAAWTPKRFDLRIIFALFRKFRALENNFFLW